MPENNQILSVEGQLVGMPLAGPESFSQQQLDYLKRALGVDETVLYENANPSQILSNTSLNLSESYLNFERIKIYLQSSAGAAANASYVVESPVFQTGITELSTLPISSTSVAMTDLDAFVFQDTATTTCSVKSAGSRLNVKGTGTDVTSSRGVKVYKIVGIHRISGGN